MCPRAGGRGARPPPRSARGSAGEAAGRARRSPGRGCSSRSPRPPARSAARRRRRRRGRRRRTAARSGRPDPGRHSPPGRGRSASSAAGHRSGARSAGTRPAGRTRGRAPAVTMSCPWEPDEDAATAAEEARMAREIVGEHLWRCSGWTLGEVPQQEGVRWEGGRESAGGHRGGQTRMTPEDMYPGWATRGVWRSSRRILTVSAHLRALPWSARTERSPRMPQNPGSKRDLVIRADTSNTAEGNLVWVRLPPSPSRVSCSARAISGREARLSTLVTKVAGDELHPWAGPRRRSGTPARLAGDARHDR